MNLTSNFISTNFKPTQYQELSELCRKKAKRALREALDLPPEYEAGNNVLDEVINNIIQATILEITAKVHAAETANEFVIPVSQFKGV